ncbi:MAG: sigma factor-like helix-turn-helix DNA-binding protein [Solirubrobacterales bacterium]
MALPASAHATIVLRRESHSRAKTEDHLNQLLEAASKRSLALGPAWLDDQRTALAFSSLPVEQRRMLLLRFGFGSRSEEVAALLRCSPEAVRQQQSRALRRLQTALEPGDD